MKLWTIFLFSLSFVCVAMAINLYDSDDLLSLAMAESWALTGIVVFSLYLIMRQFERRG